MFVDRYLNIIQLALFLYPLLALLLLGPYILVHRLRSGKVPKRRFVVFSLFVYYLLTAFLLTMLPLPEIDDPVAFCARYIDFAQAEWRPFRFAGHIYDTLKGITLSAFVHNYEVQATFFNFLLFVPFGFFLRYLYRLGSGMTLALSFGLSLCIELVQLTGLLGYYPCPYRLFQLDDLIINTAGSMYGFALMPFIRFLPRISERPFPVPRGRIVLRRVLAFSIDWVLLALLVRLTLSGIELRTPGRLIGEWGYVLLLFVAIIWLNKGQSLGKMFLRIRLVKKHGERLSLGRILLRYTLLLLVPILFNWICNHWTAKGADRFFYRNLQLLADGIWYAALLLPILWRSDRRGLHDLICGSNHEELDPVKRTI